MTSHYVRDVHGGSGVPLFHLQPTLDVLITLSPFPCISLHTSAPLRFVPPFPSLPSHAEMQYSTDLELILASVPSPAPFRCLNGPSYPILTPRFPPNLLSFLLSLPLSTLNTFQSLLMFPSSSFLSSYTLSPISQTGPIPLPSPLVAWSGQLAVKLIRIWKHKQNS